MADDHDKAPSDPTSGLLGKYGFTEPEELELEIGTFGKSGYPKPSKCYRFILSREGVSIEDVYFYYLDSLRHDWGSPEFDKITDIFSASEQSSFFGASQQRLGIQQDKVSQFLAAIGKMVKELFQFVRELRILDERLALYRDSSAQDSKTRASAEISLKGIWIDLVEGGSKSPGSVYGMAREVGFTILPDLFFSIHPLRIEKIDAEVDALEFNRKVKEVLKRKLRIYMEWKRATFAELDTRRKFTLQYFRQHYDIIKLYMDWIKPYLRNIRKLGMDYRRMDSADLVSAFEGSMVEVEFIAKKKKPEFGRYTACVLMHFLCRTRPQLSFQAEGYNRGPVHVGKIELTMRSYAWTDEQIGRYRAMRREEDFELLSTIDDSLKLAMESLGDELKVYLAEAGEELFRRELEEKRKKEVKRQGAGEPFLALGGAFKEMFGAFSPKGLFSGMSLGRAGSIADQKQKRSAKSDAENSMWKTFKNYRKANKLVTW